MNKHRKERILAGALMLLALAIVGLSLSAQVCIVSRAAPGKQVFTSDGTFNWPAGHTSIYYAIWGAGGGGGGGSTGTGLPGAVGGGGACQRGLIRLGEDASGGNVNARTLLVYIGTGGQGGAGGTSGRGGGGGASSCITYNTINYKPRIGASGGGGGGGVYSNRQAVRGGAGGQSGESGGGGAGTDSSYGAGVFGGESGQGDGGGAGYPFGSYAAGGGNACPNDSLLNGGVGGYYGGGGGGGWNSYSYEGTFWKAAYTGGGAGYGTYTYGGGGGAIFTASNDLLTTEGIAGNYNTPGYSTCPDLPAGRAVGGNGGVPGASGSAGGSGCVIFYWGQKPW